MPMDFSMYEEIKYFLSESTYSTKEKSRTAGIKNNFHNVYRIRFLDTFKISKNYFNWNFMWI